MRPGLGAPHRLIHDALNHVTQNGCRRGLARAGQVGITRLPRRPRRHELVSEDPFAGLVITARLWAAALFSLALMGLVWSSSFGFTSQGVIITGYCDADSAICSPDILVGGYYVPGSQTLASQAPIRALLVIAALCLVTAAGRRTVQTRRAARSATFALAIALALALSIRSSRIVILLAIALALALPPVWGRRVAAG